MRFLLLNHLTTPATYTPLQMSNLAANPYELMLKEDLTCWHCNVGLKNMPVLKAHLQEEWDKQAKQEKSKKERRRKLEYLAGTEKDSAQGPDDGRPEEGKAI